MLQVKIVGAGIGGLSVAIALRRTGAQVELFEKSNFQNEIGAAITITPNGIRILERIGFDSRIARGVECKQMRMVDTQTLEDRIVEDISHVEEDHGSKFMFFHRVDLHSALKDLAVSDDGRGPPVSIRNGQPVAHVDCDGGKITLGDGTAVKADLIVVADGIRSKTAVEIIPRDKPLQDIGSSFYRCLVPFAEINKHPELAAIWKDQEPGFWVPFELSTGLFLVTYPCRDHQMLNIAFKHKTKPGNEDADDWNTQTSIEDVIALVEGCNPLLAQLLSLTTSVSVHKVFRKEPLDRYSRGRAVIIGDAAHPIQPTHAQGAVLAIEEAAALSRIFTNVNDPAEVPNRLSWYNELMKRRIHTVQLLSDATPGLPDDFRKRAEDVWERGIFPETAMNFTKPVRDFFYGWDVDKEARELLAGK